MFKLFDLYKFLTKREKIFFSSIFFGIFVSTILEMLSFTAIIPLFKLLFSNEKINFLGLSSVNSIYIVILFISLFVIKNLFLIIFNYFYIRFIYNFCATNSKKLFLKGITSGYEYFKKNSSKFFLRKVSNDVENMRVYIMSCIILITETVFVISLAVLLLFVDFRIFLLSLFIFSIVLNSYFFLVKKRIKNWSYEFHENTGKLQSIVNEGVIGIKDIIIYNLQNNFYKKFSTYSEKIFTSQFKIEFLNNAQRFWMELLIVLIFLSSIIFIIYFNNQLSEFLPIFALYAVGIFRLVPSFNKIIINRQNYNYYYESFKSIINQLDSYDNNYGKKIFSNNKKPRIKKFIEFRNVKLKFDDTKDCLFNGINLKIKKNSSLLVKGKNGSGKTTFINLLSGLIDPTEGSILIDGQDDLKNCKKNWLLNIGYVQQNIFLLNSTIKNNIVIDESRYDHNKFDELKNLLSLDKIFENIDVQVNENNLGFDGVSLSGGQRQIISIARALYRDSEILIFDEADSALDVEKTDMLKEVLKKIKGTKTIIMVSHKLSDLEECFDEVLEIKNSNLCKV